MNSKKIQLLVERIDKAISTISQLKEENNIHLKKIQEYEEKFKSLDDEISSLRNQSESQKKEIDQADKLHEKLEQKIEEILNCLPDDEELDKSRYENSGSVLEEIDIAEEKKNEDNEDEIEFNLNNDNEESDEERIKKFVGKSKKKKEVIENKENEFTGLDLENSNVDLSKKDIDVKSNKSLLEDEKEDITLYFDDDANSKNNDDLPKGIL